MNRKEIVKKWLERAKDDLKLVDRELREGSPLLEIAALHLHQAVHKTLTAFLIENEADFAHNSDPAYLLLKCLEYTPDLAAFKTEAITGLAQYGINFRHPELGLETDAKEFKKIYKEMQKLLGSLNKKFPSDTK